MLFCLNPLFELFCLGTEDRRARDDVIVVEVGAREMCSLVA